MCGTPAMLKEFAEGKVTLDTAYEHAADPTADSAAYNNAVTFGEMHYSGCQARRHALRLKGNVDALVRTPEESLMPVDRKYIR